MTKNLIAKMRSNVAAMRDNERGAETIEIIVFLAVFLLGMIGVIVLIRNNAADKGNEIADCIEGEGSC
jgi:Flp pilus assembly pilin Flp